MLGCCSAGPTAIPGRVASRVKRLGRVGARTCATMGHASSKWALRRLGRESDLGCLLHAREVLRLILDTETMEGSERDTFLAAFYDHYI